MYLKNASIPMFITMLAVTSSRRINRALRMLQAQAEEVVDARGGRDQRQAR